MTLEDEIDGKLLTEAIVRWLSGLSYEERILFLRRYWFGDNLKDLAKCFRTEPNKLAGRMFRLRNSLKNALEMEGISL